jgi:hypothetical protein
VLIGTARHETLRCHWGSPRASGKMRLPARPMTPESLNVCCHLTGAWCPLAVGSGAGVWSSPMNDTKRSFSWLIRLIGRTVWRVFDAEGRAIRLLKENLSATQLEQYEPHRHFDVIGGHSGKRYRIRPSTSMNIDEYDADGRLVTSWCFVPEGPLGTGDVMLAQKFALELFETDALSIAGRARLVDTSSVP